MALRSASPDLLGRFMDDARQLGWKVAHASDSRARRMVAGRPVLVADPESAGWPTLFLAHAPSGRSMAVVVLREAEELTGAQAGWLDTLAACGIETLTLRPSNEDRALSALADLVAA